jgi:hypothetical protein
VDLYEKCLRGLLRDWLALDKQADREDPKLSDSYVEALLELLAGVAHALHRQGLEQFTEKELANAIRGVLGGLKSGDELYGQTPGNLIQELKRDGVLVRIGDDDPAYLFLHRTFQEYLAARELARQAKDLARYAEIIHDIAERLWWLPDWREVIVLLAGWVDDPVPLLKALVRIPRQTGHRFHGKLDSDSTGTWTVIPRQTGQSFVLAGCRTFNYLISWRLQFSNRHIMTIFMRNGLKGLSSEL